MWTLPGSAVGESRSAGGGLHLSVRDSVAQLVEHATFNRLVLGSSPSGITSLPIPGGEEASFIDAYQSIVLHAVHSDGAFFFWGERVDPTLVPPALTGIGREDGEDDAETMTGVDAPVEDASSSMEPAEADTLAAVATTVATATTATTIHPFAADIPSIAAMLQQVQDADPQVDGSGDEDEATAPTPDLTTQASELRLMLPHRTDHPDLPAPSLALGSRLGFKTPEPEDLRPQATMVPAIKATSAQAANLLSILGSTTESAIPVGHDVRFWCEVATFALELVADQRFVPTVVQREGEPVLAKWVPWLADSEIGEPLRELALAMPPAAAATIDLSMPDRWTTIEAALESMVDALVRRVLIHEEFEDALDGRDPVTDRQVAWLTGLLGSQPEVASPPEISVEVMRGARSWLGGLIDPTEGRSVRLCLQLSEPLEGVLDASPEQIEKASWPLGFHLLITDDPPTIIDAAQIWADGGGGRLASVLGPEETAGDLLLGELARAQRIWPRLQDALEDIDPTEIELGTAEAHAFLQDVRPILQEAGVEVLAPSWWGQATSRIGVRLSIEPHGESDKAPGMGLSSLVDYAWEISIGDESVGLEELRRLAEQGVPLIRIGDRWVEIRKEDFEKANSFLEKHPGGASTLGEVLRLAASGEDEGGPQITGIRTSGWVQELLGDEREPAEDRVRPIEVPEAFKGTLRPYQERGLAWLAFLDRFGLGGCLADDMGLGKTIQMIALLQHERATAEGRVIRPTLLVCPMSVAGNWRRELERFAPELRVHIQHGPNRPVGEDFATRADECDVVVTTYALVSRDRTWIECVEWERVVLDEAQHVKNPPTKQATAIRSLKSRHRVALTGTPVENRLTELWSIMEFCLPGFLGPQAEFRRRYAIPIERHRDELRGERLKQLVGPFVLRRLKTDEGVADDLPPLVENRQHVPLTPEQARLYDTVVQDMLRQVDEATGMRRRGLVLSGLVRLKQICNHPAHFLKETDIAPNTGERLSQRSGKSARLVEILEEVLAGDDRALVFTQFRQMGHLLATILRQEFDMEPLFLHGGTPQGRRDQMIERFQSGDSSPIFLLSLKAGGVGVNLTSANHVIHFDRWWNPAVENQATDRAFRIGQTRTVNVHKMITSGTLEERIDQMIEQKTDLARRIIGTGESWLTELDSDRLRDVLSLRETSLEDESA